MQLLTILLQATSDPLTVWQILADKGMTLAILGVIAWVLWKRSQKLEDKITSYLDNDRKDMIAVIEKNASVIENNTQVMRELIDDIKDLKNANRN